MFSERSVIEALQLPKELIGIARQALDNVLRHIITQLQAASASAHLQRLFPVQKVRHMYFTGEMIDAAEAYRLGAVERVVPRAELREAALGIARRIAAKSPVMIALAKEALTGIEDGNLEDKYRWEQGFTLQAYTSPDSAETRRAFVEKREAKV